MPQKRYSRRARALEVTDKLMPEQVSRLRAWAEERCPKLGKGELDHELELWLMFHVSRGTLIKDVEASAREWMLRGERHRRSLVPRSGPNTPRVAREVVDDDNLRRQVEAEDPEDRRRAIEEARARPWRGKRVDLRPDVLNGDD